MANPLDRSQIAALTEALRTFLAALDAGEIAASAIYRARVEGALAALETVLGERSTSPT